MERTHNTNSHSHSHNHRDRDYDRNDRGDRSDRDHKRRRDSDDRSYRRNDRDDRDDRRDQSGRRGVPAELNTLRDIRSALNYQNRLLEQLIGPDNLRLGKFYILDSSLCSLYS